MSKISIMPSGKSQAQRQNGYLKEKIDELERDLEKSRLRLERSVEHSKKMERMNQELAETLEWSVRILSTRRHKVASWWGRLFGWDEIRRATVREYEKTRATRDLLRRRLWPVEKGVQDVHRNAQEPGNLGQGVSAGPARAPEDLRNVGPVQPSSASDIAQGGYRGPDSGQGS